jgi:aldose 1-epimerase
MTGSTRPAYHAQRTTVAGIEVIQLADATRRMEVSIAPSIGNMAYEFCVNGKNLLWFPFEDPACLKALPVLCGIPFLGPWANRIDSDAYRVNGKRYLLNAGLGNLRRDEHGKPIHGLLNFSGAWTAAGCGAGERSAWATARLPFWKHPELMAQFPFAHEVTVTYRLAEGSLEIETTIENQCTEPMPVAIGYHPYFRLHDAPRDEWLVHLAANQRLLLNEFLIPTGEREPALFEDPHPLRIRRLDDVFDCLTCDGDGKAHFWVSGNGEKITVSYGPKYRVAVVFAPEGRDFICFEPMAAITNAFNLADESIYHELQTVPPGGQWTESFWITPSGF